MKILLFAGAACCQAALLPVASAGERLSGPFEADVIRVIDGDTLEARVHIWLGQTVVTRVRLAGIDAPERRARCAKERRWAEAATQALTELTAGGAIRLQAIEEGRYPGRITASVNTSQNLDIAAELVRRGVARRSHDGRRADPSAWCG